MPAAPPIVVPLPSRSPEQPLSERPLSERPLSERPLPVVREAVRGVLTRAPAYFRLTPNEQRALAQQLVSVCDAAARLVREEAESERIIEERRAEERGEPLAVAQTAGDAYSGRAAREIAGTTRSVLNAVSFPRFVTELINGVFKAIGESNMQQMHNFVELINNVSASLEGFSDTNMGPDRARQWLAERFPVGLVTNGIGEVQRARIDRTGIEPLLAAVAISGELGVSKPSPAIFDWILSEMNVTDRAGVLMIGDSLTSDIAGARAAGIRSCWFNPAAIHTKEPVDHSVATLAELERIVE